MARTGTRLIPSKTKKSIAPRTKLGVILMTLSYRADSLLYKRTRQRKRSNNPEILIRETWGGLKKNIESQLFRKWYTFEISNRKGGVVIRFGKTSLIQEKDGKEEGEVGVREKGLRKTRTL